jgi:ATP-GRASP peptide maturase of grasp-with-spasm system
VILIFSQANDYSTFEVMKWLNHLGESDVLRINSNEKNAITFNVRNGEFSLRVNGSPMALSDIGAVWYRKGFNWLGGQFAEADIDGHSRLTSYLNNVARKESNKLSEYLHYLIEQTVPVLGSAFKSDLNKLITLNLARTVGLKTPEFHVINERQLAPRLLEDGQQYITKAMSDGVYLFDSEQDRKGYFTYTESFDADSLAGYPDRISPSFLQAKIKKSYEVRVFYLDGRFFAWAIISQSSTQTSTDYRKYDYQKPNRVVPYSLPESLEQKLLDLFRKIGLNTGSVDLMVDSENDHYFLEINPVGQFGALSKSTNYQLEIEIARWLIEHARLR